MNRGEGSENSRIVKIYAQPSDLRLTFLTQPGARYAKEASGHRSDRYIWRYVRPDRLSLANAIDAME
jgi:hypothetical protein